MKLFTLLCLGTVALAASTTRKKKSKTKGPTVFNGIEVPPMLEITPDNFESVSNETQFMLVKHFSPYCPHCLDFAPIYQTLYEYYYTSKPLTEESGNFTEFYDIRFATMNCIAFYDLCSSLKVSSYPSTVLYKGGEPVETVKGVKGLDILTKAIEPYLEAAKPGSRPKTLNLPEPGDDETPPPRPVENFNPGGVSIALNATSFETLVATTQKPWFIKFYAPWCHHCQAMRPNWEQMAKEMKGKLNIGEVNCDAEPKLCREVGVAAYPSLLFFKGPQRVEYEGLRGLGDFVEFAETAAEAAREVPNVTAKSLQKLEGEEDVIFIYFYDDATTSEDFMALERFPLSVVGRARVVKTKDPELAKRYKITTFPRLLVSREKRPTYYNPITPEEMRDVDRILSWMKSVWLPIVPELVASNAREIMDGKIVVLGILNREDPRTFQYSMREMKKAANEWMDEQIVLFQEERQALRDAKQNRIEEAEARDDQRAVRQAKAIRINMDKSQRKEVAFAWVDGVFWQRWLRTTYGIEATEGNRVIINDEDRRRYWDTTLAGGKILVSRAAILDALSKVVTSPPEIKPKFTIASFEKLFFDIRMSFVDRPYFSTGVVVLFVLAVASWFRRRMRRARGNHLARAEDGWSTKELLKEGFSGGGMNGNGKVD
ncbi:thioredoxin [Sodiomyces alkalinus F11]|uniref:Thioredoxin n=1 Tax=Sodiomyces alkalinus (strain CBS 110278 / VKM F-3762 / F11) TaxID=1314773 RepID=A0A3N2Q1B1_SODAK|nr:thioredoxin [Sodiomyces alkalinus F11]ROT40549.1 thioredoxin [Sodiomyces alkalinus F11]